MQDADISTVRSALLERFESLDDKSAILKAPELRTLFMSIRNQPEENRREYGASVNALKVELETLVSQQVEKSEMLSPIDVTAPFDVNAPEPPLLLTEHGTVHPLMSELETVLDIFYRMGFTAVESREIDDEFHMFTALNFPAGHPARDEYDTFMTKQTDVNGEPLVAPAHTSIMQHRILKDQKADLESGKPIAAVIPGRVFRNEDLDARHEHTFYQFEGIYVDKGIHAGNLLATFKTFLSEYYQQDIEIKSQPFYFPFTEPSFELALSCPFCQKKGCHICSQSGWIELLGMGMIHPNVLKMAGIDPDIYTGFAWGCGLDRLVMMKYGIEDVRHFESAKLDFLRQFA